MQQSISLHEQQTLTKLIIIFALNVKDSREELLLFYLTNGRHIWKKCQHLF